MLPHRLYSRVPILPHKEEQNKIQKQILLLKVTSKYPKSLLQAELYTPNRHYRSSMNLSRKFTSRHERLLEAAVMAEIYKMGKLSH